jgi:methionyl-tRNA formyltransferase
MGTPDFAVPALAALCEAGHEIAAVYTQPPRQAGRGMAERRSGVHEFALSQGLDVRTPANFRNAADRGVFAALKLDAAVVAAYGLLLPEAILNAPRHGCFNIHASLLPRWRGAAPIQRAIMAGDTLSGITIMHMDEGLDTGAICATVSVPIGPEMTAGELHDRLAAAGGPLMVRALENLAAGELKCTAQPEKGVSYARKIAKTETRIDWSRPAVEVHNHIRGLSPFPGAWFRLGKERIKVLASSLVPDCTGGAPGKVMDSDLLVACSNGAVRLTRLQRAGRRPAEREDFLRGFAVPAGTHLD